MAGARRLAAALLALGLAAAQTLAPAEHANHPPLAGVSVGALVPAPELPPGFAHYLPVPGESLAEVAARFGLSEEALRRVNADGLVSGAALRVPPRAGALLRLEAASDVVALALRYGVAPSALMEANALRGPKVPAGRWIFVPDVSTDTPAGDARLAWPLAERGAITSGFGPRAVSVVGSTFHAGLDIAAALGTPVLAAAEGRVSTAGWGGAYGYVVFIDHEAGLQTRYAHLNRIDVRQGERVRAGSPIGVVGLTGATTGPHLHFEVRQGERAVDPRTLLP